MHRQMADMMKAMGGKGKGGGMMRGMMGGLASKMGLGGMSRGMGGMPDLSKMDPQAARSPAEAGGSRRPRRLWQGPAGRTAGPAGGGLPGLPGGMKLPGPRLAAAACPVCGKKK